MSETLLTSVRPKEEIDALLRSWGYEPLEQRVSAGGVSWMVFVQRTTEGAKAAALGARGELAACSLTSADDAAGQIRQLLRTYLRLREQMKIRFPVKALLLFSMVAGAICFITVRKLWALPVGIAAGAALTLLNQWAHRTYASLQLEQLQNDYLLSFGEDALQLLES